MSNYGKAGPGREYESNPDPRFNPEVAEQIRNSIANDRNPRTADQDKRAGLVIPYHYVGPYEK